MIETSLRCHGAGFICISIKLGKQGNLVNNMAILLMAELLEQLKPASRGLRLPLAPTPRLFLGPAALKVDGASVTETPFLFFQATARDFCDAQ